MKTLSLTDAQATLVDLVDELPQTGDVVITRDDLPVARLSAVKERPSLRDLKPFTTGGLLRPFPCDDDDLLGDLLEK